MLLWTMGRAYATDLSVRIFSEKPSAAYVFTAALGVYYIFDSEEQRLVELHEDQSVVLRVEAENIAVWQGDSLVGVFPSLSLDGEGRLFSRFIRRGRRARYAITTTIWK